MDPAPRVHRFGLADLAEQLAAFAARWPGATADRGGLQFAAPDGRGRLRLPLLAGRAAPGETVAAFAARCPARPGRHAVLLLRAGAAAMGYWDDDDLLRHKAIRAYVVRGHGKAQPTHRKTRGKSRYGARLRLQNWRRLLTATNERLAAWWDEFGPPELVVYGVPVRVLADLLAADPPPPFRPGEAGVQRLPMYVHRPDHEELLRVRRWLGAGRLELAD